MPNYIIPSSFQAEKNNIIAVLERSIDEYESFHDELHSSYDMDYTRLSLSNLINYLNKGEKDTILTLIEVYHRKRKNYLLEQIKGLKDKELDTIVRLVCSYFLKHIHELKNKIDGEKYELEEAVKEWQRMNCLPEDGTQEIKPEEVKS